jgi:DNA-directed RNA polymerase alpha subunit
MNDTEAPDILDQSITELELSVRANNALSYDYTNGQFTRRDMTVRQLVSKSAGELLREPNFGRVSLKHVRAKLAEHGLYLRDEGPPPPQPRLPVFASLTVSHRLSLIEAKLDIVLSILSRLMPPP